MSLENKLEQKSVNWKRVRNIVGGALLLGYLGYIVAPVPSIIRNPVKPENIGIVYAHRAAKPLCEKFNSFDWSKVDWDKPDWGLSEEDYKKAQEYIIFGRAFLDATTYHDGSLASYFGDHSKPHLVVEDLKEIDKKRRAQSFITDEELFQDLKFPRDLVSKLDKLYFARVSSFYFDTGFSTVAGAHGKNLVQVTHYPVTGLPNVNAHFDLPHELGHIFRWPTDSEKRDNIYRDIYIRLLVPLSDKPELWGFNPLSDLTDRTAKDVHELLPIELWNNFLAFKSRGLKIEDNEESGLSDEEKQRRSENYKVAKEYFCRFGKSEQYSIRHLEILQSIADENLGKGWDEGWVRIPKEKIQTIDYNTDIRNLAKIMAYRAATPFRIPTLYRTGRESVQAIVQEFQIKKLNNKFDAYTYLGINLLPLAIGLGAASGAVYLAEKRRRKN